MGLKQALVDAERAGTGAELDKKLTRDRQVLSKWAYKKYKMSYHTSLVFLYGGLFDDEKQLKITEIIRLVEAETGIKATHKAMSHTIYRAVHEYGIPKNVINVGIKGRILPGGELPDNQSIKCQKCSCMFLPSPTNWVYCEKCYGIKPAPKKKKCLKCNKTFKPTKTRRNICYQCSCINRAETE